MPCELTCPIASKAFFNAEYSLCLGCSVRPNLVGNQSKWLELAALRFHLRPGPGITGACVGNAWLSFGWDLCWVVEMFDFKSSFDKG